MRGASASEPGLPQADGYFDLIYAMSVYTHIVEHWAGWLLEHRRVLARDGLLLVSFLGEGMIEPIAGERWDDRRIGMNVVRAGASFDRGGPNVLHSPWWLRAHWGRASRSWPYALTAAKTSGRPDMGWS